MSDIRYNDWLVQSRYSKYPFSDTAEMESSGGTNVPLSAFLDCCVRMPAPSYPVYVSKIRRDVDGYSIQISDDGLIRAATDYVNIPTSADRVILTLRDPHGIICGHMICDGLGLAALLSRVEDQMIFSEEGLPLLPRVIFPEHPNAFKAFTVGGQYLSGRIWHVADLGMIHDIDFDGIQIHVTGEPLPDYLIDDTYESPVFIEEINGIPVIGDTAYVIIGDNIVDDPPLRIQAQSGGIKLVFLTPSRSTL